MNKAQKDQIRLFIVKKLFDGELRLELDAVCREYDIHPFEAIDFYESQAERINKLFDYPGQ